MRSSYNFIKGNNIVAQGNKEINTEFNPIKKSLRNVEKIDDEELSVAEKNEVLARQMESYESLAKILVENARRQGEDILSKAFEEAQKLEAETYAKAFEEGKQKGEEDAYNATYNVLLPQAEAEAAAIIENAKNMLVDAKKQYEAYLESKKEEIINFAVNMAEQVLKRELKSKDGLNQLIYETIKESRNADIFIIRTNKVCVEEIKSNLSEWKETLGLKSEIFVVLDESITEGNAIIEKNNGKIEVGIDIGMKSIKEELL
jgi:flagellar assembly protein FliH